MKQHKKNPRQPEVELRNRYALDRTALANERTYLAWTRTGLASLVGGLATEKYLDGVIPIGSLRFMATTLILFSILCFLLSAWRYRALHVDLRQLDIKMVPISIVLAVSLLFSLCAILAVVGLWIVIGSGN